MRSLDDIVMLKAQLAAAQARTHYAKQDADDIALMSQRAEKTYAYCAQEERLIERELAAAVKETTKFRKDAHAGALNRKGENN
jgi:hypothetical protein